ncbi:TIGR02611 family protein [Rhodococcus sp. (in: high G+C Gram-positive bacteria)]|uniref:TIGR02611 family protein n=1 Tax=Rhodococcus sp. TaxID=1831 RepID=UPI003BB4A913
MPDIKDRLKLWRAGIALRPTQNLVYRFVVAVAGTVVLAVGIVAIPYPGPGWLIVFAGLGILASEFTWARRILHAVRIRYDRFMAWFSRQSWVVRGVAALGTGVVVLGTLWVLGAVALVGGWVGVDHPWLTSPL